MLLGLSVAILELSVTRIYRDRERVKHLRIVHLFGWLAICQCVVCKGWIYRRCQHERYEDGIRTACLVWLGQGSRALMWLSARGHPRMWAGSQLCY
jgi:hypothetical protein